MTTIVLVSLLITTSMYAAEQIATIQAEKAAYAGR